MKIESLCDKINTEAERHREEEDMPDGMRKWNFEDFRIGRKTYFDIKVKRFMLKYR